MLLLLPAAPADPVHRAPGGAPQRAHGCGAAGGGAAAAGLAGGAATAGGGCGRRGVPQVPQLARVLRHIPAGGLR